MKIIHFITSIDKIAGGTTAYMQSIACELKNYCELVIATGNSTNPSYITGVRIKFFDLRLNRLIFIHEEFSKFLRIEKPNLVHINGIWMPQNWIFQKEAQRLGIKVILSPHGMLEPYILKRHPFKKKIAMALYQNQAILKTDFIHTTAQSELDNIHKLGYYQSAVIIPNGIEISRLNQKKEWIENPQKKMLFLSRVHPKKGIEALIEAISLLKPNNLKITIAGEGEPSYVDYLIKKTQTRGVSGLFDFVGGVYGNQKWKLYQESDFFVLPTYSENFGIVIAEALAIGIPVITTTGTPWKELNTRQCGWWIELNVKNLSNAIDQALKSKVDELKSMGLRGKLLIEEKYDIKLVAKEMYDFYLKVNK